MRIDRRWVLQATAAVLAMLSMATAAPVGAQGAARPAAAKPALVVFITVDQLRPDYLIRWHDQLTGGLRRLVDQGAFAPQGVHDHAITETAPGHASTLSGRFPYSTGIARNSIGVNTTTAPLVGSPGIGASPFRFNGTTLADWMIAADARTKVLSVSRKDRGAILPIGRAKLPVFWYAQGAGNFVTSTWYADSLPSWVQAFNAEDRVMKRFAGSEWSPLLPEASYPEADSVPGELPSGEVNFPHFMPDDTMQARNLVIGFPVMDEFTLDFAWRGVRAMDLGAGPQTDLLAISLSTTDAVGHRWGPDSRELHDQVLRLDRSLGVFLDSLIALRGADRIVLALTADHGVAPSPDVRSSFGDNSRATRVFREAFDPALASLSPIVRRDRLPSDAFGFDGLLFEVDRSKVVGQDQAVREMARAFAREARKVPGVERVDVIDDLAKADTVKDTTARRWLHMFRPGGEVLATITLTPYSYVGRSNTATHGSPHDYDATVPIIFWGTPFTPGRVTGSARVVDIAPTLARLLGIPPLERLDGHPLPQVFRTAAP
ncbi:MAG: alkaline phosphatase family protein [Gemmatimonadetes bacterium]|nr:alkaline phosphatase family protein [Gemmatimonadota bacterium]